MKVECVFLKIGIKKEAPSLFCFGMSHQALPTAQCSDGALICINNQVILTTTLKHEELGKYDSIEGINHINYISHIPSKILDGRYVADFLGLLSALSIKVQS